MDTNKHISLAVAEVPKGRAIQIFIPVKDFSDSSLESVYMAGYRYSVREGNEKLAALVKSWAIKGLVKLEG